ncbi:MAG: lipoyl(octanoyl) transferase LipB [Bacteroidetes bacterium]|nr:lipoyl(octanoyl) transferase LipB [Bacteroidota bacterium]
MQNVNFKDLGTVSYQPTWDYQTQIFDGIIQQKIKNRSLSPEEIQPSPHHLLFCEHNPVYTLGKSGSMQNVLLNEAALAEKGIEFFKINRGGDITFHGPGQVVGYPILDLDFFFTDIHKYMRFLEEVMIRTLAEYGIKGGRIKGVTGVWLDGENPLKARKICAFGVKCSRWVTMHGWAFNVNTDLNYFNFIIPCGIKDKAVTSLQKELGREVDMEEVKTHLKKHFAEVFECHLK